MIAYFDPAEGSCFGGFLWPVLAPAVFAFLFSVVQQKAPRGESTIIFDARDLRPYVFHSLTESAYHRLVVVGPPEPDATEDSDGDMRGHD